MSKILKRTEYEEKKCKYLTHKHKNISLLPLIFVLNSFNYSILSSNTTPRSEEKQIQFLSNHFKLFPSLIQGGLQKRHENQ